MTNNMAEGSKLEANKNQEAKEFVRQSLGSPGNSKQQQTLLESLNYSLPALKQAVAYIKLAEVSSIDGRSSRKFDIGDYLKVYSGKKGLFSLVSVVGMFKKRRQPDTPETIATQVSLDTIVKQVEQQSSTEPILLRQYDCGKDQCTQLLLPAFADMGIFHFQCDEENLIFTGGRSVLKEIKKYPASAEENFLGQVIESLCETELDSSLVSLAMTIWEYASKYEQLVKNHHKLVGNIFRTLDSCVESNDQAKEFGEKQLKVLEQHLGSSDENVLELRHKLASLKEDPAHLQPVSCDAC